MEGDGVTDQRSRAGVGSWTALDWAFVVLAAVLALLNLYVGVTTGRRPFYAIAGGFVALAALAFTRYWHPTLSLVAVLYALVLGVVWLLSGMQYRWLGVLTGVVSLAFVGVALALFYRTFPT